MSSEPEFDLLPFVRKIESIHSLSACDRQALLKVAMEVRELGPGEHIVREGDRPVQCCLLLDGFAQRYKVVANGGRQILSFHIPGDVPDLLSLHAAEMDHTLSTVSASRVGLIAHRILQRLIQEHPLLGEALWRDTLVDAAMFREWMVSLGRRDARARVAHFICEFVARMAIVGLAPGRSVRSPITQGIVADIVGLSTVHVNRVLQQLRGDGLITWRGRVLTVSDWEALTELAEFDPAYLHLGRVPSGCHPATHS